jgi:hypothetical protein
VYSLRYQLHYSESRFTSIIISKTAFTHDRTLSTDDLHFYLTLDSLLPQILHRSIIITNMLSSYCRLLGQFADGAGC